MRHYAKLTSAKPAATAGAWVDGHQHAFRFFGSVPHSVLYDNDRCLVSRILPDGTRRRARLFSGFLSHYLIRDRYGRPGKGNDKGAVEGLVGWARRNFMVPLPRFGDFEALNRWLEARCRARQEAVLRGHQETIGARLARDREAMGAVPGAPFEACEQVTGQVSSQSLVRYRTNDYSVPVAYGHRAVWVRAYVDRVVIGCGGEVIARHLRCYEREDMVFNPLHYLPLLERKLGALDQAAPLAGWKLPEAFHTLRRLMEARAGRAGRREYVQVLRLQKQLANHKLLIIDELGFVPLSKTGAELLFEVVSQRYERAAVLVTSNLPFDEWTETFGSERLTGALLDRIIHYVHILEMNGESFRLNHSRARKKRPSR